MRRHDDAQRRLVVGVAVETLVRVAQRFEGQAGSEGRSRRDRTSYGDGP